MSDIQLACPECKLNLEEKSNSYRCSKCETVYPSDKGFVDFLGDKSFYAGEIPQKEMQNLLSEIDKFGYELAVSRFLNKNPQLKDYVADRKRADWISHCLSNNNSRCLDIGSGLGNISELLSKMYDKVYSLEAVVERIEYQRRRFIQANCSNIVIVRSNALKLPFQDNYFDLVVCNGVMEWVGIMNKDSHPREAQLLFLKEIRRVLSDNGCLYIGIENRFGIPFVLGAKDHSGLPYTSIMPRALASILVNRWGREGGIYGDPTNATEKRGYRTYTYSLDGYKSLFKSAGFKFRSYWVYPSYNIPLVSGRIDDKIGIKGYVRIFRKSSKRLRRVLFLLEKSNRSMLRFFAAMFTPSFLFYCYRTEINPSFDDIVLSNADVSSSIALSDERGIKFLLFDDRGNLVKVARLRRYGKSLPHSLKLYEKTCPNSAPEVSERAWMEVWIPGRTINPYVSHESEMAIDWLIDFQKRNDSGAALTREDILFEANSLIDKFKNIPTINIADYTKCIESYKEYACSLNINKNCEHGDFFYGNIIIDSSYGKLHVIDWEYYTENGNPLFDFVFFIITSMYYPKSLKEFCSNINGKGDFSAVLDLIKEKMNGHFNCDIKIEKLIPYAIMRSMARRFNEGGYNDRSFIEFKILMDDISKKI